MQLYSGCVRRLIAPQLTSLASELRHTNVKKSVNTTHVAAFPGFSHCRQVLPHSLKSHAALVKWPFSCHRRGCSTPGHHG